MQTTLYQNETVPPVAGAVKDCAIDESTLSPDQVLAKIQAVYVSGVKRCYKDTLKRDPTARGKVVMKFTVNATGRAVTPSVDGFDTQLDQCIRGRIGDWRFSKPIDKDGDPTQASFAITVQLVPE